MNEMERLTFDGNFCDIAQCKDVPGGSFCEDGYCSQRSVWERLKEYEDTGKTPEEVAALVQAESEGRLVELPCKVGSRVYEVFDKYTENKGCGICCCKNIEDTDCEYGEEIGDDFICTNNYIGADGKGGIISTGFKYEMIPYFGKTVFLTREAAEAALAAQEERE